VPELDAIYRLNVDTRQAQLVGILEALSTPGALPAVVNCTAGKDRTGVVIAAVLSLLGVPPETIVEDFAASAPLLADSDLADTVRARVATSGGDPATALRLLASPPEHMQGLLDYVGVTYGGVESLVRQAGLSLERIERLRTLLLE
jgi:protein-tyrosine phosphatase